MLQIETTKFVITAFESSCLMVTSTFNLLPILFALHKYLLFYASTSFGTGFFSLLYWRNPVHGWRRTADLYYAKYSFVVYLLSGMYCIPFGRPSLILYLGATSIGITYYMTYVFPKIWIAFHITFHLLSIFMKLYILFYIGEHYSYSYSYIQENCLPTVETV